ncbi:heat stress transcription factor A-5 [Malania oleifera]|uniref:heat stress transcription factor A-5 n=1 Tax=Malania oleifera TaxID=397392 RepID=UPI0025AE45B6|nr:heat stress transcription factor A-5 [Malania oleifera]
MDGAPAAGGGAAGGGGGGPAPFLLKTYDMVDDSSTEDIVSWSSNKNSFVVWNPPEFSRLLLPTYFKHNNFSSFIRQLNTYGFRKIDPERWEFANEDFVKDQKHLLKNIHRRKPIHSHSQSHPQGSLVDPERAAFDEEIERLSREKNLLETDFSRFKQQQSAAKLQLEDLMQRVLGMEQRQDNLLSFLEKAVQNPTFVEHLAQKIESMDFSAYNKKRRLPQLDHSQPVVENSFVDEHSCCRPELGNISHHDFSNKLNLELSPAVSDVNLVSHSTQSSNEEGGSPERKGSEGEPKDAHARTEGVLFAPEMLELSDTGTSFKFKMDSSLSRKVGANESTKLHSLQKSLTAAEEGDGHISCHLNLTLASSSLQANESYSTRTLQLDQEIGKSIGSKSNGNGEEASFLDFARNRKFSGNDATLSSSREAQDYPQGLPAAQVQVNDVFWEQFLTERPGSSDTEEASSNFRANSYEDQDERRSGQGMSRNTKNMEQLTL